MTHPPLAIGPDASTRLQPLLERVPVDPSVKQRLCALMSGPDRFYHGVDHLLLLWERHRRYGAQAGMHEPTVDGLIACAIAFHDAIYAVGRSDNETRSAQLWMEASEHGPLSDGARTWVAETIVATRDHLAYQSDLAQPYEAQPLLERARLWFLDLDMSPIGECAATFHDNTERLRAENPTRAAAEQEKGRLRFLARIASHPRIYRSPVLAEIFEAPARVNLARELA